MTTTQSLLSPPYHHSPPQPSWSLRSPPCPLPPSQPSWSSPSPPYPPPPAVIMDGSSLLSTPSAHVVPNDHERISKATGQSAKVSGETANQLQPNASSADYKNRSLLSTGSVRSSEPPASESDRSLGLGGLGGLGGSRGLGGLSGFTCQQIEGSEVQLKRLIGQGAYGKVWLAEWTGCQVGVWGGRVGVLPGMCGAGC